MGDTDERRRIAREALVALERTPGVAGCSLIAPQAGPCPAWTIDVTCTGAAVSPPVLGAAAEHELTLLELTRLSDTPRAIATFAVDP